MLQLSFVKFPQNSLIFIEGTPASDKFYIIQTGKVRCYSDVATPGSQAEFLGPGDFIGVISCMSGKSQAKNVTAITEVTLICVQKSQYPELIAKNTPVALKIVKSFARDMRTVNDQLTKITAAKSAPETPENIFSIADYYENSGHKDIAAYAYYQYLKECPSGINIENAKRRFVALKVRSKAVYYEPTPDSIREYPENTMIMVDNQHGNDMFIIQQGSVAITKVVNGSEIVLAVLKKGDMFGEMALLENKPRSANAIAKENCRLMVINRTNFNQMVSTQPQMISKLTTTFADRLWGMFRQLGNTQLTDNREKMIDMLALQIEKSNVQWYKGSPYSTGYSVMDLLKFCNIPQKSQNLAFSQLQSDQLVKIKSGKIEIPDVDELIKQAAFYRKQLQKRQNADIH